MLRKNFIKGLLVSFMLLCSAHIWAYDFEVDNIQYTIISTASLTVQVSGLTDTSVTEVIIPEKVEYRDRELTVISIGGKAFNKCAELTSISIPNSVISIGDHAFDGCSNLTEVTIPNSVTSIGDHAFDGCSNLTEVTIPNSVTSIGSYAFYECSSLTEITIPDSVTKLGGYAFYGCTSLAKVTLGNSVTSIGVYTFYNCSSLVELDIPNSVTSIGIEAFVGCSSLDVLYVSPGCGTLSEKTESKLSGSYILYFCRYPILWTNGPYDMRFLSLKDGTSSFSVRGLSE